MVHHQHDQHQSPIQACLRATSSAANVYMHGNWNQLFSQNGVLQRCAAALVIYITFFTAGVITARSIPFVHFLGKWIKRKSNYSLPCLLINNGGTSGNPNNASCIFLPLSESNCCLMACSCQERIKRNYCNRYVFIRICVFISFCVAQTVVEVANTESDTKINLVIRRHVHCISSWWLSFLE